jgi:hypothetical protein
VTKYLDWTSWISCLEDVKDYDSPWFALENLIQGDLWTLLVPQEKIRWCSLEAQGENLLPVQEWFYPDPENIRNEGETPQALVELPIHPDYLKKVEPAKDVFRKAGLWSDILEDLFDNDYEFQVRPKG